MGFKHGIILFNVILMAKIVVALPNIVLILTDDQDLVLDGLMPMKKSQELLANEGKIFLNAYVNTPICCPSRSTILTGKYPHNTGVFNNSITGGCSNKTWQEKHEPMSIASILRKEQKYVTFYAGKYLNQYGTEKAGGTEHIPPGYDWWVGLKGNSRYYNYTLSVNGTAKFYGDKYLTDVLSDYSLEFLETRPMSRPFFMIVAPPAPHAPFTPAERHENAFNGTKATRTPAFNFSSIDKIPFFQKHWIVDTSPKFLPENVTILDKIQEHRFESLLAVDEMVEKIVKKLESKSLLDDTYIILTSDNGFHIGQFSLPWDKRQPYETDIRVPFLIRGPGIPKKLIEQYPITAVDIAPTILDLASVDLPVDLDGESVKKRLFSKNEDVFWKNVLIEYWGEGNIATIDPGCNLDYDDNLAVCSKDQWCKCQDSRNNTYSCIMEISNSKHFKFCQFKDDRNFIEAYDLKLDYFELENMALSLPFETVSKYEKKLNKMKSCSGKSCKEDVLSVTVHKV